MTIYRGRRAAAIENQFLRVTVLQEGGHIAEILDKETGINPLWTPPWDSIEPSAYGPGVHAEYGAGVEGKLLAGIMGHNLCLDLFGGPSDEEFAAGITVHGEGSVAAYEIGESGGALTLRARFPLAQIAFERRIELLERTVRIHESVENLTAYDRPIGWTQHVTLGPPFLEKGVTQFRAVGDTVQGVGKRVRRTREAAQRGGVRLASGKTPRWRRRGFEGAHGRRGVVRVYHALDGSGARARVLRGLCSRGAPGVRVRVEAGRFSVDGDLGREP